MERASEELARLGCGGLALTPGPNLRYFTGISAAPSERLLLLVLPVAGDITLVAPGFERERMQAQARVPLEIAGWAEAEDPFALALRLMDGGSWLLDPEAPFWIAARFAEMGVSFRSAGGLCATLRRRKDPRELELLSRAQSLTRSTLAAVPRRLATGITERELADEIVRSFRAGGADGWALVQFGEGSALPHADPGERRLVEDSAVLVDLGAVVEGYHGDMTRCWWYGARPRSPYGEVAGAVEQAQARAAALARPGVPAAHLDRAAREYLESRGLGRYFTHRLGHGVGLEIHEEPYLREGSDDVLQPGDVFTIEPGAYLPGRFGVRHEDVWIVGEEGGSRL